MINVMANLVVTANQLGCNNDCYQFVITAVTTKLVVTAVMMKLVLTAVTTKLVVTAVARKLIVSAYF